MVIDDLDLAAALDAAIAEGRLSAVFQPQIDLATGRIVAAEGLCRWTDARFGFVAPDRFIPLAEQTGAIHAIGQFMIDQCIAVADRWTEVTERIEMSVNVSPLQLTSSFATELESSWRRRGLPIEALTLEITESLPLPDLEENLTRLVSLREAGIGISLDDFGTGHASIHQLGRLPVTEVKLDRSLIQSHAALVSSAVVDVVDYAHTRGLRVVAEGIETEEQLEFARRVGCDRAQGYLLGMPMGPEAIAELLTA